MLSDNCTCMAGFSFACCHIAALLFKLETAVHLKLKDSTTPTSVPCSWKSVEAVEPAPLIAGNFSKVKKRGLPGENTKNVPHKITNYSTKNPSAGKFPLKSEIGNRSQWLRYQQPKFQWHRYVIWGGRQ